MSVTFTITDRKESIQVSVSNGSCTVELAGNPSSRCRFSDVFYVKDGSVTFPITDTFTLGWGVLGGRSGIYDNRRITVTLGYAPSVLYEVWGVVSRASLRETPYGYVKLFEEEATVPMAFTLYQYRGELRMRKETA